MWRECGKHVEKPPPKLAGSPVASFGFCKTKYNILCGKIIQSPKNKRESYPQVLWITFVHEHESFSQIFLKNCCRAFFIGMFAVLGRISIVPPFKDTKCPSGTSSLTIVPLFTKH